MRHGEKMMVVEPAESEPLSTARRVLAAHVGKAEDFICISPSTTIAPTSPDVLDVTAFFSTRSTGYVSVYWTDDAPYLSALKRFDNAISSSEVLHADL